MRGTATEDSRPLIVPAKDGARRFGAYLRQAGHLSDAQLLAALNIQRTHVVPFGRLAMELKGLTSAQTLSLVDPEGDRLRIGERAIVRGLLSAEDVQEILEEQRRRRYRLGDVLVMMELLSREAVEAAFADFSRPSRARRPEGGLKSHEELVERLLEGTRATLRPRAIIIAGGYGAGKSYLRKLLLKGELASAVDADSARYLGHVASAPSLDCQIVLDHILTRLPRFWEGICGGVSCDPASYRRAQAVAHEVFARCVAEGKNLLYEASFSRSAEGLAMLRTLTDVGFDTTLLGLTVSKTVALYRVERRARFEGRDIVPAKVIASHTGFLLALQEYAGAMGAGDRLLLLDSSEEGRYTALLRRRPGLEGHGVTLIDDLDRPRLDLIFQSFGATDPQR